MDFGKVFISSVLNPSVEDLRKERNAVREIVDSFGFLKAWAFESSPASPENLDQSYLQRVEECDVFILILGSKITAPVNAEWLRAKKMKKPILVFLKGGIARDSQVDDALDALNKKYKEFKSIDELKEETKLAVEQTLILGIRSLSLKSGTISIRDTLSELAERKSRVRVGPMIPPGKDDVFMVNSVEGDLAILRKGSNGQEVDVPLSRIVEVLPPANSDHGTLTISGRLQWITLSKRWKFLAEPVGSSETSLGLGKISSPHDPDVSEIRATLERQSIPYCWDWIFNLGDRIGAGWEVFYDNDGRYMRYPANPSEQILVVQQR